jgi:hypothetical protein
VAAFALGLTAIGVWPDYLFPLLWLAPLGAAATKRNYTMTIMKNMPLSGLKSAAEADTSKA